MITASFMKELNKQRRIYTFEYKVTFPEFGCWNSVYYNFFKFNFNLIIVRVFGLVIIRIIHSRFVFSIAIFQSEDFFVYVNFFVYVIFFVHNFLRDLQSFHFVFKITIPKTYVLGCSFIKTYSLTEQVVTNKGFCSSQWNCITGLIIKCLIACLMN